MRIGKILDPDADRNASMEAEMQAVYQEAIKVKWRYEVRHEISDDQDDRVFMDVSGVGRLVYDAFRYRYPELADRIIPVSEIVKVRR